MASAWYMKSNVEDRKLKNHCNPPKFLNIQDVYNKIGVQLIHVNLSNDNEWKDLANKRKFLFVDEQECSRKCDNYEDLMESFFAEHLHEYYEIRLITDGSGYFDVRDLNEQWIRIEAVPGYFVIIPPGIYHRFSLDVNERIKGMRFFLGENPDWTSFDRPCADEMECRKEYLRKQRGEH